MIDAVIVFGMINVIAEFVMLSMIGPRWRLRLLGNRAAQTVLHATIMVAILIIHWGTLIGTMSGFFSFILSIVTVSVAKATFGYIENDKYHVGLVKYKREELK